MSNIYRSFSWLSTHAQQGVRKLILNMTGSDPVLPADYPKI